MQAGGVWASYSDRADREEECNEISPGVRRAEDWQGWRGDKQVPGCVYTQEMQKHPWVQEGVLPGHPVIQPRE